VRLDPADGFDTAQWIGAQAWCDGNVGAMGSSYDAATAHAMAIAGAPFLKALTPRNAMTNIGRYGVRHNGAFELRFLNWVFSMGYASAMGTLYEASARAAANPSATPALMQLESRVREYIVGLPLRPGTTPLKFAPDYERWLIEAMRW